MTTIDPSQRLAAAVRAQLASLRGERTASRSGAGAPAPAARRGAGALSAATAQRIQAIPPDAPDRPRQALRLYLEAELAREFGAGLVNDPRWPELLDAVQQRMDEDAQAAAAAEALGRLLAAGDIEPAQGPGQQESALLADFRGP